MARVPFGQMAGSRTRKDVLVETLRQWSGGMDHVLGPPRGLSSLQL